MNTRYGDKLHSLSYPHIVNTGVINKDAVSINYLFGKKALPRRYIQ